MFFYTFDERSAGLSNVVVVAILTGYFVYGVRGVLFGTGGFVVVEEGHQCRRRGECSGNVVTAQGGFYLFMVTSGERDKDVSGGRGLLSSCYRFLHVLLSTGHDEVYAVERVAIA